MNPGYNINTKRTVRGRRWWVTVVATNGEPLSHSEQLNSLQAAQENIEAQLRAASIEAALRATDE